MKRKTILPNGEPHRCPECGEKDQIPTARCICRDPLFIVIRPGSHIHIHCPVHGDVKIYGSNIHWLDSKSEPIFTAKPYLGTPIIEPYNGYPCDEFRTSRRPGIKPYLGTPII